MPAGHIPLAGFFLVDPQPEASEDAGDVPFDCIDDAETVELEDAVELSDEEELVRGAVLRGPGMNILLTSSDDIPPFCGPLAVFHPREGGWNDIGGATAVICKTTEEGAVGVYFQDSAYVCS